MLQRHRSAQVLPAVPLPTAAKSTSPHQPPPLVRANTIGVSGATTSSHNSYESGGGGGGGAAGGGGVHGFGLGPSSATAAAPLLYPASQTGSMRTLPGALATSTSSQMGCASFLQLGPVELAATPSCASAVGSSAAASSHSAGTSGVGPSLIGSLTPSGAPVMASSIAGLLAAAPRAGEKQHHVMPGPRTDPAAVASRHYLGFSRLENSAERVRMADRGGHSISGGTFKGLALPVADLGSCLSLCRGRGSRMSHEEASYSLQKRAWTSTWTCSAWWWWPTIACRRLPTRSSGSAEKLRRGGTTRSDEKSTAAVGTHVPRQDSPSHP